MIFYVYVHAKPAPPTYLDTWSMAGLLGLPLEYLLLRLTVIDTNRSIITHPIPNKTKVGVKVMIKILFTHKGICSSVIQGPVNYLVHYKHKMILFGVC